MLRDMTYPKSGGFRKIEGYFNFTNQRRCKRQVEMRREVAQFKRNEPRFDNTKRII